MQRKVTAYRDGSAGERLAVLECGHTKILDAVALAGSDAGQFECPRCENFELPPDFVAYKQTPVFTENTLPNGLRKDHSTAAGVWGKIIVELGRLRYRIDVWDMEFELDVDRPGIVVPGVLHYVAPLGEVRFYVQFYRAPQASA